MIRRLAGALMMLAWQAAPAPAADSFTVAPVLVSDEKAVFATVESASVVPARARIGGTVAELRVREGERVERGQTVAAVGDEKLALELSSLDAQIEGLRVQLAQAEIDLARAEELFQRATISRARLDEARTQRNVASNALKARTAERAVVRQRLAEGQVLAPASGRVLRVPVTVGTVVMPGETVAMVAEENYVLRLRVPERHARFLKAGDAVRLDAPELGRAEAARNGEIRLVYPGIEDGRVVADARVDGLGDYFVGERVRVWVSAGERTTFIVPAGYVATRFGVDFVRVATAGGVVEVPVQPGGPLPRPDMPDGIEILSGIRPGDVLVRP